jgi:hypothetical protein
MISNTFQLCSTVFWKFFGNQNFKKTVLQKNWRKTVLAFGTSTSPVTTSMVMVQGIT